MGVGEERVWGGVVDVEGVVVEEFEYCVEGDWVDVCEVWERWDEGGVIV